MPGPVFLDNDADARIEGLVTVVGTALLILGLVEAELRAALGEGPPLPGDLPRGPGPPSRPLVPCSPLSVAKK